MSEINEEYKPEERRKDYPILFEKLQGLEDILHKEKNQWSFLGFTVKDLGRTVVWLVLAAWWGAGFYNKIDVYESNTKRLLECDANRDRWATAKYGHPFECGKPIDGWQPNFGNAGGTQK